jgi:hypothetical protein
VKGLQIKRQREVQRDAHKAKWQAARAKQLKMLRKTWGDGFKTFDPLGVPQFGDCPSRKQIRGSEVVEALERASLATGDPVFDDALRAFRSYGLDCGGLERALRRAHRQIRGDRLRGYLDQMRYFVEHKAAAHRLSVPAAAERIAAEFGVAGASFEAIVDELSRAFRRWKAKGYPPALPSEPTGNLGYTIHVAPTSLTAQELMPDRGFLEPGGAEQLATLWWRRRFREGAIRVAFVRQK